MMRNCPGTNAQYFEVLARHYLGEDTPLTIYKEPALGMNSYKMAVAMPRVTVHIELNEHHLEKDYLQQSVLDVCVSVEEEEMLCKVSE